MLASDLLSILFAGTASAVIGFVWYHPKVLGSIWMRLSGVTPEIVEKGKRRMHMNAMLALSASMVAAYVINLLEARLRVYDLVGAVELGFLLWAGFVAPALSGIVLWEQKSAMLYIINIGYWLVSFVAMAVILLL